MSLMVETRITVEKLAEMTEDCEHDFKVVCKNFANDMRFYFDVEYYSVYWTPENWLLAKLAMPNIEYYLKEQNGTPNK